MRVLYVVQRYGDEVFGGAEQHCREFAERLVARDHDVNVLTTCALSYVDWGNHYEPGLSNLNGVSVRRFPTAHRRNGHLFGRLNARALHRSRMAPRDFQIEWMRMQGPWAPQLPRWLTANARTFDIVICITYLYWTTWSALTTVAGATPTLLHPTAHDEPPLQLSIFDEVFHLPDAHVFLTPEERDLVAHRFPGAPGGEVIGIGVDLDRPIDGAAFRRHLSLGSSPYICYVGRVDPAKGAAELIDFFVAYKDLHPSELKLVFVGEPVMSIPDRPDIVTTGYVDAKTRDSAIAEALALVHPSYFESFSMVLTESFARRRPALVQGRSQVMAGHAKRSNAALPYNGFAEFDAALSMLEERPQLADELGRLGRRYVEEHYAWETVMNRYEQALGGVQSRTGELLPSRS